MPNADLDGGGSGHAILTNGSLGALTVYCPDGGTTRQLVTDLADRLVTELDAGTGNQVWSAPERPDHRLHRLRLAQPR